MYTIGMRFIRWSLLVSVCFLFSAVVVGAQNTVSFADVSLSTIPLDPKPLESVIVEAQSYSVDLDQATLEWKYNGQVVANGVGKRSISVRAPGSGLTGTISVSVRGLGFETVTATIVIRPASTDVLWEAVDAYTPPFYKGKAILPLGGRVRAVAVPTASAPSGLTYKWSQDGSVQESGSGYGKSSFVFTPSTLRPTAQVGVETTSGSFAGSGSVLISPKTPSLVAYQKQEGFIDYASGFSKDIVATGPGTVLVFAPYFFSVPTSLRNNLLIDMKVDGVEAIGPKQNELRFSRPENDAQSSIAVSVETVEYTLQALARTFTLRFR